jgi:uncharacterized protein YeaC (DUF1315 family)
MHVFQNWLVSLTPEIYQRIFVRVKEALLWCKVERFNQYHAA